MFFFAGYSVCVSVFSLVFKKGPVCTAPSLFCPQAVLQLEELTAGGNAQRLFEVAFSVSEISEPKVR